MGEKSSQVLVKNSYCPKQVDRNTEFRSAIRFGNPFPNSVHGTKQVKKSDFVPVNHLPFTFYTYYAAFTPNSLWPQNSPYGSVSPLRQS